MENGNIDFDTLVHELLRAVRGKRSQLALSRRLGYTFNQVAKWETGHKRILWNEFVRLCVATKTSLPQALVKFYKFTGSEEDASAIVKMVIANNSVSEVSRKLKLSRHSISNWISSKSDPSVQELFRVLTLYRGGLPHLLYFAATLAPENPGLPSIADEINRRRRLIEFSYRYPWLGAVTDCLKLGEYQRSSKHIPGFVARHLRISLEEEKMALSFLAESMVLALRGGKYVLTGSKLVFQEHVLESPDDQEGNFQVREFWWEKALEHLQVRPPWKSLTFAFQTFSVSQTAHRKIRALSIQYFNEILRIIEEDTENKELLQVMNLCFFDPSVGHTKK